MRYVAFLRGMNLGGRRITNEDLCECFSALGLQNVWAFLASGNVAFEAPRLAPAKLSQRIEVGLREALGYEVPTFLRDGVEVARIAEAAPFVNSTGARGGKLQVSLLASKPTAAKREAALSVATRQDQLAVDGRELYWLPEGKITESALDFKAIEKALGAMTMRTRRTIERLAKKLADG